MCHQLLHKMSSVRYNLTLWWQVKDHALKRYPWNVTAHILVAASGLSLLFDSKLCRSCRTTHSDLLLTRQLAILRHSARPWHCYKVPHSRPKQELLLFSVLCCVRSRPELWWSFRCEIASRVTTTLQLTEPLICLCRKHRNRGTYSWITKLQ